jgi:lipopolysaccharide export system permease protein
LGSPPSKGDSNAFSQDTPVAKLLSTRDLIKVPSPGNLSELAWRFGLALSALNFVILALALASGNPRSGRSGNLIFVLLSFVVYNNLVSLGQGWIVAGLIGFGNFLLLLHGGVFLLGLGWLAKRHFNWAFRLAPRLRRPPAAVRANGSTP